MSRLASNEVRPTILPAIAFPRSGNAESYFGTGGGELFEYLNIVNLNNSIFIPQVGQNLSANPLIDSAFKPLPRQVSAGYSLAGLFGLPAQFIVDPHTNLADPQSNVTNVFVVWTSIENSSAPANLKKLPAEGEVVLLSKARAKNCLSTYTQKYSMQNWDGYNADPINQATIDAAELILANLPSAFGSPDIAPGADGSIGFEWIIEAGPLRKLYIDIGPGNFWSIYCRRSNGDSKTVSRKEVDHSLKSDLESLLAELSA